MATHLDNIFVPVQTNLFVALTCEESISEFLDNGTKNTTSRDNILEPVQTNPFAAFTREEPTSVLSDNGTENTVSPDNILKPVQSNPFIALTREESTAVSLDNETENTAPDNILEPVHSNPFDTQTCEEPTLEFLDDETENTASPNNILEPVQSNPFAALTREESTPMFLDDGTENTASPNNILEPVQPDPRPAGTWMDVIPKFRGDGKEITAFLSARRIAASGNSSGSSVNDTTVLKKKQILIHSALPENKPLEAILRGMPDDMTADIEDELIRLGLPVLEVLAVREFDGSSAYKIKFKNTVSLNRVRKHKILLHCFVYWRRYRAVPSHFKRCLDCQRIGHTAEKCNAPHGCVECIGECTSAVCERNDRSTPTFRCDCHRCPAIPTHRANKDVFHSPPEQRFVPVSTPTTSARGDCAQASTYDHDEVVFSPLFSTGPWALPRTTPVLSPTISTSAFDPLPKSFGTVSNIRTVLDRIDMDGILNSYLHGLLVRFRELERSLATCKTDLDKFEMICKFQFP